MEDAAAEQLEVEHIAAELEAYLEMNEAAADTLDGIVRWWWQSQRYQAITRKVERAVALLHAQGVLASRTMPSGDVLYFLNRGGGAGRRGVEWRRS